MKLLKKGVSDKLVEKLNNIDTSGFVLKICMTEINQNYKKNFLMLVILLKTDYDSKISEIENKIPSMSGLATTSALTVVENKKPNVSNLVKKTD